ncbi:MAG TPA: bifunctional (p)ppGpp synthetase/guanosine-3',5'-bis(diphosphate) 3'-pyrophosphohydrolase [Dehalococcoidales bacterium]|nr:bifunctional (p)ppGpp synthetase/guanosine-3',5'-bis(diphosphate) 3'-pyrophosphohydrolase [Dehalococcoidales bacterium]
MSFQRLLEKAQLYLPPDKVVMVREAFEFASQAHEGQNRVSGDPYIEHPLQIALTLTDLQLDASSIAAALLHDVVENCDVPIIDIETRFGSEVARLVDGVTRLGKIGWAGEDIARRESQAKNLRKMLVAMAEDIRVVFIKLADRLHNMQTLHVMLPEKQKGIARETMEIYAPLAHRLGIWELKWQLEDLAFRYLEPEKYRTIARLVVRRRVERENLIGQVIQTLKSEFEKAGLKGEIYGRPKHIYSIYLKMEKYESLGKQFDDIHDLQAVRVLVSSVADCYNALGIIHTLWHPMPDEFDDYIANPKPNGYQSLHTSVMCFGTTPLELQIRTYEMHHVAEYGVAAHWRYKEGEKGDVRFEERISWLRQLIDWHREFSGAEEFLESVKTDIFNDQVFVYTPKGEIKDLPRGSTPLDFAYRIHTELGHHCVGAKINGKLQPLNYKLNNGDIVEIMTVKSGKGPSQDWLRPNLGYVNTSGAREKIRQWFKKQKRQENIERGRYLLERELKRLGIKAPDKDDLAQLCKFDDTDDFLAALGYGGISAHTVVMKLVSQLDASKVVTPGLPTKTPTSVIKVLGVGDMLTRLGECCHPVPGDAIIGYITRSRGVTVHKQTCPNVIHEKETERLVEVEWGLAKSVFPVKIQVEAWDRVGLIRDISTVVAEEKVNISSVSFANQSDHTTLSRLTLETSGLAQLSRIMEKIEGVRGVIGVIRVLDDNPAKEAHGKSSSSTNLPKS